MTISIAFIVFIMGAEFTSALYASTAQILGTPWTRGMGLVVRIAWIVALPRMLGTMLAGAGS